MDETAFRQTRAAAVEHPCPFEKALLAGCASCALAQRRHIAEREAVACPVGEAQAACLALLALLRRHAAFALHRPHAEERLTHAQEMKVQCGGLAGLRQALAGTGASGDIGSLVRTARQSPQGLEGLPYPFIIRAVAAWQPRRRTRR